MKNALRLHRRFLPLVAYALFGTSRTLAVGPVAVVSLLTATAVGTVAEPGTPEYLGAAIALALFSGLMLILTQSPLETLNGGCGSCRDLAVLLAEAARTLGLGARLVSGYLFDPENDLLGSAGSGSTHAWVEIFIPGAAGSRSVPPTGAWDRRTSFPCG